MTFRKAIPFNVVHDGLDGLARTRRIPGSAAKRFMAIRLEEHGMATRMQPWLRERRAYCSGQIVNSHRSDRFGAQRASTAVGRFESADLDVFYVRGGKYSSRWTSAVLHSDPTNIRIQSASPAADLESNWLPSTPEGLFLLVLRAYMPDPEII